MSTVDKEESFRQMSIFTIGPVDCVALFRRLIFFVFPPFISIPFPFSLFVGGLMWFWILYRFSNDYKVFLGLEHPWDGHHGDEHGHDEHDEKKEHH